MAYGVQYYKENDFGVILENAHRAVQKSLTYRDDSKVAGQIEMLLSQVKKTALKLKQAKNSGSKIVDQVNSQVLQLIQDVFNEQSKSHSKYKTNSDSSYLFSRSHFFSGRKKRTTISGADDIFQEQLATLLKVAVDKADLKIKANPSVQIFLFGGVGAKTITMDNNLQLDVEKQLLQISRILAQQHGKRTQKSAKRIGGLAQVRQGKIDIKSPYFEVNADAEDICSKIVRAFSGRTFTVKNYSSYNNQSFLGLGDTNLYESITGTLSSVYKNPRVSQTIYYRGMEYLNSNTKDQDSTNFQTVNKHFAHLRFIYQLRGAGLIDPKTQQSMVADFIIWNDPNSQKIIVRSTNQIIKKVLENYNNPFVPVKLSTDLLTGMKNLT